MSKESERECVVAISICFNICPMESSLLRVGKLEKKIEILKKKTKNFSMSSHTKPYNKSTIVGIYLIGL